MKEEKEPVLSVIANDTGEVTDEFFVGDSYCKTTAKQREYWLTHKEITRPKSFMIFDDNIAKMIAKERFTGAEISVFFSIIPYIGYYELGGKLVKTNGTNFAESLNTKDLKRICSNIPSTSFERAVEGLIKKEILIKETKSRSNTFYVNPFIFWKWDKNIIPMDLYHKFKKTKWNIYNQ